jgi:thiol-disulfide isomerase/thioredoxin
MKKIIFAIGLILSSTISFAQDVNITYENFGKIESFVFGDDDKKDFEVLYFFSYSCSACYELNETTMGWKKSNVDNSDNIEFRKIPVIFKDYWVFTSKAFFIANGLNLKIDDNIYNYFHKDKKFIIDDESLIKFFKDQFNVDKSKIMPFLKSPSLLKATSQAMLVADKFEIMGTPSFVVIDKEKNVYKVNKGLVSNNLELISTLTYLVKPKLRKILKGVEE